MDRREAISALTLLLGGTIAGAELFMGYGCNPAEKYNELFDQDQVTLLREIAETILPETSTPGAKAAGTGEFMALMVQDCYAKEDQDVFLDGLSSIDNAAKEKFSKKFLELNAKQRTELLTALDKEQRRYQETKKAEEPNHYFRMMKELTLLGFFTSEAGATKALRYVEVPGRFDACVPYKKGDRAWAT
jgi:hypothetical protein